MGDLSQFKTLKLDEQPTAPNTSNFKTLKLDSVQSGSGAPASTSVWDNIKAEYNAEHDAAQKTRVGRFLSNAVDSGVNAGSGVLHLLADASDPSPVHANLVMNEILPAYLAGKKMVNQGVGEVKQAYNNPGNESLTNRAIVGGSGLAHIVGGVTSPLTNAPAFDAAGQQIASGHISAGLGQAVGNGAAMALGAKYGPELGEEFGPTAANTEGVLNSLTNDEPIKGATTPKMIRAHAGILARGTAQGKGFVPQDVSAQITPAWRQAAADHPEFASVARGETQTLPDGTTYTPQPHQQFAAYMALLDKSTEPTTALHNRALASVADHAFDPSDAQAAARSAFPSELADVFPEEHAAVNSVADQMGAINTLGKANAMRQYLNRFLGPEFRKNLVAAGRSPAEIQANMDAANALRDSYYKQLGDASGYDLQDAKRIEAGVLGAKEGLQNAIPGITSAQAIADQPMTIGNIAGEAAAGMAKSVGSPTGLMGMISHHLFGQEPFTQLNSNVGHLLTDLPEPSGFQYQGPLRSAYGQAPFKLPADASPANPIDAPPLDEGVQPGIPNHFEDWVRRNAGVQTTPAVPQYPQLTDGFPPQPAAGTQSASDRIYRDNSLYNQPATYPVSFETETGNTAGTNFHNTIATDATGAEVGHILSEQSPTSGTYSITHSSLHPGLHGQGIGARMYQHFADSHAAAGNNVVSDSDVSPAADSVWQGLVNRGMARPLNAGAEGPRYQLNTSGKPYNPTTGFDDGGNMVERVHPYNMQLPTGYTVDPTGATRIDFSAPDSLLNMLRMKAGKTPFDQYARPRDPQQMYVNPNNPQLGSGLPQANNVSVTGSIVNGPPRPTNPTDILAEWQQDRLNGNE